MGCPSSFETMIERGREEREGGGRIRGDLQLYIYKEVMKLNDSVCGARNTKEAFGVADKR